MVNKHSFSILLPKKARFIVGKTLLAFLIIVSIWSAYFVFATVTVTRTDFTTNAFNFNEDLSVAYNITVNNTVASLANGQVNNITQVNITLPSSFVLSANSTNSSFGSGSFSAFSISGTWVLSWINKSDGVINASVVGTNQTFGFNATALTPGIYNITVVSTNFSNVYNSNITVRVNDTTVPVVGAANITLVNRVNASGVIILNVSVVDNSLINSVRFNISNSSGDVTIINSTNPTSVYWNSTINTASYADGVYNLTILANDTYGGVNHTTYIGSNLNNSARIEVVFDNTAPSPSMSCTPNPAQQGDSVTCTCSGTDALSGVNATYTSTPSTDQTGSFTQNCNIVDKAGNTASTSIQLVVTGSGGGGSGTGGSSSGGSSDGSNDGSENGADEPGLSPETVWTQTYSEDDSDLSEKVSISTSLGQTERVSIQVGGTTHHVGVKSVTETSATIEISSTHQEATLNIGESKKVDLTEDGYYETEVTLVSITDGKAQIIINSIYERVEVPADDTPTIEAPLSLMWLWIIIAIVVIVAIVIVIVQQKKKKY